MPFVLPLQFLATESVEAVPKFVGQLARAHQNVTIMFMDIVGFTQMSKVRGNCTGGWLNPPELVTYFLKSAIHCRPILSCPCPNLFRPRFYVSKKWISLMFSSAAKFMKRFGIKVKTGLWKNVERDVSFRKCHPGNLKWHLYNAQSPNVQCFCSTALLYSFAQWINHV